MSVRWGIQVGVVAVVASMTLAASASARPHNAQSVQRAMNHLIDVRGGPPGAGVVLYRHGQERFLRAGVADVKTGKPFRRQKYMRIASVAKAFSGAVMLSLVHRGRVGLDDNITSWVPSLPAAWSGVTVRQLMNHTSGVPDFTGSRAFGEYFSEHLHGDITDMGLIDFVRDEPLRFAPGSEYKYSNSDNIIIALVSEAATGVPYVRLLERRVLRPLDLRRTSLPKGFHLAKPRIEGYDTLPEIEDLTECCSAAFASASGGVVSTPHDLAAFTRAYVGSKLFGRAEHRAQFSFVAGGRSDPPGPGSMSAGLSLFRYRTKCGTVFGHTGNIFGYTQFTAATRNGKRSATVSINRQITPNANGEGAAGAFPDLRRVYRLAACAILR